MPIRRSGNFDLETGVIRLTQEKLSSFLNEAELAQTEVMLVDGKITFNAPNSVLSKIMHHFGQPAG